MWMDHRALVEASAITESKHSVLDQVGGVCSPEFSMAKLLWLKNNDSERFESASAFLELPDYLTWRCVTKGVSLDTFKPSNCSLTCKWGYNGEQKQWPTEFYNTIGLQPLLDNKGRIGG